MSQRLRGVWQETRDAFERESYRVGERTVDLSGALAAMRAGTHLYLPDGLAGTVAPVGTVETRFEVTGESTLVAAARLVGEGHVAALNFASARRPGGGVANGARAQEESLSRSSALYDSLTRCPEFYEFHRGEPGLLYSDRVIWSPGVPVYRDDRGGWLPEALSVSFLTSAAPNRRMIERNREEDADRVPEALTARARGVLAVAADQGVTHLVLGAWGCGVFGNHPEEVADAFATHLHGEFAGVFEHVVFAVLDRDDAVRDAFSRVF